jgi:hypothetical protein
MTAQMTAQTKDVAIATVVAQLEAQSKAQLEAQSKAQLEAHPIEIGCAFILLLICY